MAGSRRTAPQAPAKSDILDAVVMLAREKDISEDLIISAIEEACKAAYRTSIKKGSAPAVSSEVAPFCTFSKMNAPVSFSTSEPLKVFTFLPVGITRFMPGSFLKTNPSLIFISFPPVRSDRFFCSFPLPCLSFAAYKQMKA